MRPLGIRPTVDFVFKLLFGDPTRTSITVHFLNAVLEGSPKISGISILNPSLPKEADGDKFSVLDVRAEDEFGRQLNIEMQTSLSLALAQRLVYYSSCLYVEQLNEGDGYYRLRPALSICVLEQALFPRVPQLHLDFQLRDRQGILLTDDLQIHLVELSKSMATVHNLQEVSLLERWSFFLCNADKLDAATLRKLFPETEFAEAIGVLEMIARTPELERLHQARLKFERDEAARLEYARAAGLAEGRKEGEQVGQARGEQIGQARGEQIGQARGEQIGQTRGEQIGQIRLLEELLGLPPSSSAELAKSNAIQLATRIDDLRQLLDDGQ